MKGTPLSRQIGVNGFGLITHGSASVDPYKASLGFARAAVARGAKIFEQSPRRAHPSAAADRRHPDRRRPVTASKVVVATGYPTDDFKPLRRRFARSDAYVVLTAASSRRVVRREMTPPELILRDTASPDHWMHWIGNRVLFTGADQPSVPDRAQRTRAGAADRAADVRAVGHALGDFRAHAGILVGRGVFAHDRRRAVLSARTGTIPHHLLRVLAADRAASAWRSPRRASSCATIRATPDKGDEPFSFTRITE